MKATRWIVQTAVIVGCLFAGGLPQTGSIFADDISVVEMTTKNYEMTVRKKATETAVLPRGFSIGGESMEGKSAQEARAYVESYVQSRKDRAITLTVFTDNEFCYNGEMVGTTWSNPSAFDDIDSYIATGNFVEQYKNQKDMDANPVDIPIELTIDEAYVREQVTTLAQNFYADPVNATVRREAGAFIVSEGIVGKQFDVDFITNDLIAQITDFDNTELLLYDLPYTETVPQYMSDSFNFSPTPLGSYATGSLGNAARTSNIALSAAGLDGTVLYPGEEVSTLNLFGPQTLEYGYQIAPGYENGQQVPAVGGGVCQTTTTLYNALLRAEIEITQRFAHSMLVAYVPPSMDAAVATGTKDLKFRNNLNYPIYLESYIADGQVYVNIWGVEERPAGRSIDFRTDLIEVTFPDPLYNVVVNNDVVAYGPNHSVGEKIRAEVETHPFVRSKSYKIINDNGNVYEEPLNSDTYTQMKGLLYVASDCEVVNRIDPSSSADAIYRYLGCTVWHGVYFKDGAEWNPAGAAEHYQP